MLRYVLLLAVAALSLSCASGGSTSEDASNSPDPDTGERTVTYVVHCESVDLPGNRRGPDCTFEVSYREADGMRFTQGDGGWWWRFISTAGDSVAVTVRRRDTGHGRLSIRIEIDGRRLAFGRLEEGSIGPITVEGEIP